jgi:hypothetical protein
VKKKPRKCCPRRAEPARGASAHTITKRMPVSHGLIVDVSPVKVEKRYGRRCKWSEWFAIDDVHVYEPRRQDAN